MFLDDTACNLASLNLSSSTTTTPAQFDIEATGTPSASGRDPRDLACCMAQFPSQEIARRRYDFRTLGLGYANLGALLMRMGIPYDSPKASPSRGALTAIMGGDAYAASAEMAAELGPFPRLRREPRAHAARHPQPPPRRLRRARTDYEGLTILPVGIDPPTARRHAPSRRHDAWDEALDLGEQHGFRNAQVTVIAPTGTIGLFMDCDTTGIEPDFALVKFKKLAGGGYFKIINQSVPPALSKPRLHPEQIEEIVALLPSGHGTLDGAPAHQPREPQGQGLRRRRSSSVERRARQRLRDRRSPSTSGPSAKSSARTASASPTSRLERLGVRPARATSASPRTQIDAANEVRLRHDDGRRRARTCKRSTCPSSTAPTSAASKGKRFIAGRVPHPHDGRRPAVHLGRDQQDDQPALRRDRRGHRRRLLASRGSSCLKANALYRDGSKLSQPLNLDGDATGRSMDEARRGRADPSSRRHRPAASAVSELTAAGRPPLHRPPPHAARPPRGLHPEGPHRRPQGLPPHGRIRGRLARRDLHRHAQGGRRLPLSLMNCFAIAISLGLQYGVPLEEFVEAFIFTRFEPNGLGQGHDNIKMATSIIDYIFRELALSYLDRHDLAHLPEGELGRGDSSPTSKARRKPLPQ